MGFRSLRALETQDFRFDSSWSFLSAARQKKGLFSLESFLPKSPLASRGPKTSFDWPHSTDHHGMTAAVSSFGREISLKLSALLEY